MLNLDGIDLTTTASAENGLYGLPTTEKDSELIVIPVPWDVTTSYSAGTHKGPQHVREASIQIDLHRLDGSEPFRHGFHLLPENEEMVELCQKMRKTAEAHIERVETGEPIDQIDLEVVNRASTELNAWVEDTSEKFLAQGKKVAVLGGDHSCPLGLIRALGKKHETFDILHIDAHADLRDAYQGFQYSHASIMHNVLKEVPQVGRLTQVAIRDLCTPEAEEIQSNSRITCFFDEAMNAQKFEGRSFKTLAEEIVATLSDNVYISFDIDGLNPLYCPDTGTPVPGGIDYTEAVYLIREVCKEKNLIGFDLCEVGPSADADNEWNGNVGARILYELCCGSFNG